uniref:AlNc14C28G2720 protein n=1 Tax=Albugo laibachii Nc14 TaxID=890382 RepID=F0W798_9STRA|nr:AlNc14C28G2720 [Albugo laibachii Nc14]|eukprot:CCA16997.1 AlNc14C28G2720 [Albugo laibachii Nc14]
MLNASAATIPRSAVTRIDFSPQLSTKVSSSNCEDIIASLGADGAHIQIKDLAEPFPIHNADTESYLQSIPMRSDIDREENTILATEASMSSPRRKKRRRRTAAQIDRKYRCTYPGCTKAYGSEGSLTQHQRLKHIQSSCNPSTRKNLMDSTTYASLHINPESLLVPTASPINCQSHRNVKIRPAIKDEMLQFLVGSNQSHPDYKFTKTDQHSLSLKPNMRSRSNSLPLRLSNGLYLTPSGSIPQGSGGLEPTDHTPSTSWQRPPVRIKARSRSECFMNDRYADSQFMYAASQPNNSKSFKCTESTLHPIRSEFSSHKVQHIENPENALDSAILSTLVDDNYQQGNHESLSPPYDINDGVMIDYRSSPRFQATKGSRIITGMDIAKEANPDDPDIVIDISDFEDLAVFSLDPCNLSIDPSQVDSDSGSFKVGMELENLTVTTESTFGFDLR